MPICRKCKHPSEGVKELGNLCELCAELGILESTRGLAEVEVRYCHEWNCSNRIEISDKHCSQHKLYYYEKYCQQNGCCEKISLGVSYCFNHVNPCQEPGCYQRISSYGDKKYCSNHWAHRNFYCAQRNCSCLVSYRGEYCSSHNNTCSVCSTRIPASQSYCSAHQSQINEQNQLKSLVQQKLPSLSNPQEVIRFTTWWNKNLVTVVNYNSGYWVFLVVYDNFQKKDEIKEKLNLWIFPTNHSYQGDYGIYTKKRERHSDLPNAQSEASWLRGALDGDNPILYLHPEVNSYEYFSSLITDPYVIKRDLPHTYNFGFLVDEFWVPSNAESYLKPLDIVWIGRRHISGVPFYHVGIYLGKGSEGKNWMCHLDNDKGVKITDWRSFLEAGRCEELIRYHPIIPFKSYSKIAKQIAATQEDNWRNGNYNLANRNCEHFANMIVYGINYSKQVEDRKGELIAKNVGLTVASPFLSLVFNNYTINNDKGSTIKLTNEMSESNDKLGWKTNDWSKWIEDKAQQEVPPKQNCRIM